MLDTPGLRGCATCAFALRCWLWGVGFGVKREVLDVCSASQLESEWVDLREGSLVYPEPWVAGRVFETFAAAQGGAEMKSLAERLIQVLCYRGFGFISVGLPDRWLRDHHILSNDVRWSGSCHSSTLNRIQTLAVFSHRKCL